MIIFHKSLSIEIGGRGSNFTLIVYFAWFGLNISLVFIENESTYISISTHSIGMLLCNNIYGLLVNAAFENDPKINVSSCGVDELTVFY